MIPFRFSIVSINEEKNSYGGNEMENVKPELIEKAKKAKTAEELRALAGENGMELTEEQANAYYAQFHPTSGEMADEELENVAGGGCHSGDGRLVVTVGYNCENWVCTCGNKYSRVEYFGHDAMNLCTRCRKSRCCENCKHMSYERGLWLCNHPANKD